MGWSQFTVWFLLVWCQVAPSNIPNIIELRSLHVSEEIHEMYMKGGADRTKLKKLLEQAGFDKDLRFFSVF